MNTSSITVKELSPELLPDFLTFFDHDAFADNPEWADCYCMFRYVPTKEEWNQATPETNRKGISQLVQHGQACGFLAFQGSKPVGWCNAAPRKLLRGLDRDPILRTINPENIGSIVCFVVAKTHRGQGIAKKLLEKACQNFRSQGLSVAEAYPYHSAKTQADNFPGPLSMYLANGFVKYRETDKGITIVRKAL